MDRFISPENIKRYRELAGASTDAGERGRIMKLLAEEEAKFKLDVARGDDAPGERTLFRAATDKPVEHDREEQQVGG
jgi:hypothetical protein